MIDPSVSISQGSRRSNRRLLAMALFVGLALVGGVMPIDESEAREVEWPLQLHYEISYYGEDGNLVANEVHEFRGTDWRNWTDVVLAVGGQEDHRSQPGHIQQLEGDVYRSPWLERVPQKGLDGFLPDSFYTDPFGSAIHVTPEEAEGQPMAPNGVFNGGYGHAVPVQPNVRTQPGSPRAEERIAEDLAIDLGDLASGQRTIAACEAATVDDCGDSGNLVVDIVYHREAEVPLEVQENWPDGTSVLMEILQLK